MLEKRTVKPTTDPHAGNVKNLLSFDAAYLLTSNMPTNEYKTTGNSTPFTVKASIAIKGNNKGKKVLIFYTGGKERARAYKCCWGHRTNCNRTYIDCYSAAIKP